MTYAYNAVGEVTAMTTGGVTTTYGYDADGELTSAPPPAIRSCTPTIPTATEPPSPTTASSRTTSRTTSTSTQHVDQWRDHDLPVRRQRQHDRGDDERPDDHVHVQRAQSTDRRERPERHVLVRYDPLGYQISSTVNGQTTNNLIDPFGLGNVAAQFDSSGNLVAHYTYGLGLVSQVTASGTAYYYDFNLQGSTVGITNAAGAYVNQYSYDPFGQVTTISAGIANPFTFVGQDGVSSDGNGLIYMRGSVL